MRECSNCKYYEQCKTVSKVCAYYTPKYCTGENCDECANRQECDKECGGSI